MNKTLLKMENIEKKFPGVRALHKAQLTLDSGMIMGLLGENGAGKSTLMNVLGGVIRPDQGNILIDGEQVTINNVADAQRLGVAFVHQELALVPHLSIAENIYLGRELKNSAGIVSPRKMYKAAEQYMATVGLDLDPSLKVLHLSTGQQQMVEIAKAFSLNARILVMDEPTSSLSEREVMTLFETVKKLKALGLGIIYISHKLSELFELTDYITVMRDGEYIDTKETSATTEAELIKLMVGRELENYYQRDYREPGKMVLEVEDLTVDEKVQHCSFSVAQGEILGFYGLIGAGRSELMQAVAGIDKIKSGKIRIFDNDIDLKNYKTETAISLGLSMVPENRKTQGLFLDQTVLFNSSIAILSQIINRFKVNNDLEENIVRNNIEELNIRTPNMYQIVSNLSGGNQQKVVLAKWLNTKPKILILDEPTRGVDVGAKAEIYQIVNRLVQEGISIIMISSELPEIINMCDRLAIMREGKIVCTLNRDDFDQDRILEYAIEE